MVYGKNKFRLVFLTSSVVMSLTQYLPSRRWQGPWVPVLSRREGWDQSQEFANLQHYREVIREGVKSTTPSLQRQDLGDDGALESPYSLLTTSPSMRDGAKSGKSDRPKEKIYLPESEKTRQMEDRNQFLVRREVHGKSEREKSWGTGNFSATHQEVLQDHGIQTTSGAGLSSAKPVRQLFNPAHSYGPSTLLYRQRNRWPTRKKWNPKALLFTTDYIFMLSTLFFAASNIVLISPRVLLFSPISFWALPVHYSSLPAGLSFCLSAFSSPRNTSCFKSSYLLYLAKWLSFPSPFFQKP